MKKYVTPDIEVVTVGIPDVITNSFDDGINLPEVPVLGVGGIDLPQIPLH